MGNEHAIKLPTRNRNRTPIEEVQARLQAVAPPLRITEDVLAMLAWYTTAVTITENCELKLELDGAKHTFFHVHAVHCQDGMQGKKIHVAFDPEFPELIHIVSADHRWLESIPAKGKAEWFDPATTRLAIAAHRGYAHRQAERAEMILKDSSRAELGRVSRNEQRIRQMQITDTFPIPSQRADAAASNDDGPEKTGRHLSQDARIQSLGDEADGSGEFSDAANDVTGEPSLSPPFPSRRFLLNDERPTPSGGHETKRGPTSLAESMQQTRERYRSTHRQVTAEDHARAQRHRDRRKRREEKVDSIFEL